MSTKSRCGGCGADFEDVLAKLATEVETTSARTTEKLNLAYTLVATEQRLEKAEATIEQTWLEIGVSKEDRRGNDDPEVATLDASVRVALRYERDQVVDLMPIRLAPKGG